MNKSNSNNHVCINKWLFCHTHTYNSRCVYAIDDGGILRLRFRKSDFNSQLLK